MLATPVTECTAKPVRRVLGDAKAARDVAKGVLVEHAVATRKDEGAFPDALLPPQYLHTTRRQRHAVFLARFHARTWNGPHRFIPVDLGPQCAENFAAPCSR